MDELYQAPFQTAEYAALVETVKRDTLSEKVDAEKYKQLLRGLFGGLNPSKEGNLMLLLAEDVIDSFSLNIRSAFAPYLPEEVDLS